MTPSIDTHVASAPVSVTGSDTSRVDTHHLPGIIIFVHGVNSDGEWYEQAEQGLIAGLNTRLGLTQALGSEALLQKVSYAPELLPNGDLNRELNGKNFITDHGRSPVIRFRWGYKAAGKDGTDGSQDEKEIYGGKIYLNELDAWGGGPFQNGTSALPYMWGTGLNDRVFMWLYANMFPVDGREVYACPPRAYYAHAAHRLKELIKAIRDKQADCPITVVCHSQGNMVTLAAALLGEQEGALADTYVMCNPPYSLKSLGMDQYFNCDSSSSTEQYGGVSEAARVETFKCFLNAVKARASNPQPLDLINRYHGFNKPGTAEPVFKLGSFPQDIKVPHPPGMDRDNRGRVFLYCNPHDQVIGVSPVQGIGWRGVSQEQLGQIGADGVFHQRVWATPGGHQNPPFAVGSPDWTGRAYRYIADNHNPKRFWNPPPPAMRFKLTLNPDQGFVSKIMTLVTSPFIYIATHLGTLPINDDPPKGWAVPITAPVLPQPVTPRSLRYSQDGAFDEGKDPSKDALAKHDDPNKLRDDAHGGQFKAAGQGSHESEAALRYEINARLLRQKRADDKQGRTFSDQDQREAVRRMLEECPNATDHSTILTNHAHAEKVLAYDVAIGWVNPSKITPKDMRALRQFANWMVLKDSEAPAAAPFVQYWDRGFFNAKQLHHTYTMQHMASHAPGIKDWRVSAEHQASPHG